MGSIDRRIEALERLYGMDEDPEEKERRLEEKRAEFGAKLKSIKEQIAREEAQGEYRRRHAFEELENAMRRRADEH